jgi:hypothetical protein
MLFYVEHVPKFLKKTPSDEVIYFAKGFNKSGYLIEKRYFKQNILISFLIKMTTMLFLWIFLSLLLKGKFEEFGLSTAIFIIIAATIACLFIFGVSLIGHNLIIKPYRTIAQNHVELIDANIQIISPIIQKPWLNNLFEILMWVAAFFVLTPFGAAWKILGVLAIAIIIGVCLRLISKITFANWPERN